ncbi:MAG: hypothetical protein AAF514_11075, partial [Verrucomicrobiota bacterium]
MRISILVAIHSLLVLPAAVLAQNAGYLQGLITDAATELPIEGVQVLVDQLPPDGTLESSERTGALGVY